MVTGAIVVPVAGLSVVVVAPPPPLLAVVVVTGLVVGCVGLGITLGTRTGAVVPVETLPAESSW